MEIHLPSRTDKLPFVTMGSGSLAAMSVFEAGYKDKMDVRDVKTCRRIQFYLLHEEDGDADNLVCVSSQQLPTAKALVEQAILAGIWNDLGSGSNVDITILARVNGKTEVTIDRNCITPNDGMALRNKIIKRDIVTHTNERV